MENLLPLKICVAAGLIAVPLLPVLYLIARRMGGWDAPTGIHQVEHHLDMVRAGRGALIDPGWYARYGSLDEAVKVWRQQVKDYYAAHGRAHPEPERLAPAGEPAHKHR